MRFAVPVVALVLASGCEAGSFDLAVDVRTDLAAGIEFDAVRTTVDATVVDLSARGDFVAGARVAELVLEQGTRSLTVELMYEGTTVVRRPVRVQLAHSQVVTVVIARSCAGVVCGDDMACVDGACASAACTVETADACPAPACASDADCGGALACGAARCVSGSCFAVDEGACGFGSYCEPSMGCVGWTDPLAALDDDFEPPLDRWMSRDATVMSAVSAGCALQLTPLVGGSVWVDDSAAGLYYQMARGDFVVTVEAEAQRPSDGGLVAGPFSLAGILVRNPVPDDANEASVLLAVGAPDDGATAQVIEDKTTENGVSLVESVPWPAGAAFLRVCRRGDRVRLLARGRGETMWTEVDDRPRPDLADEVQVGLFAETLAPTPDIVGMFWFFQARTARFDGDCLAP